MFELGTHIKSDVLDQHSAAEPGLKFNVLLHTYSVQMVNTVSFLYDIIVTII